MKTVIGTLTLVLLLSTVQAGAQTAAQKIATINLQKVYTDYWKTKKADEAIKRKALDKQKVGEGIEKDLRDLDDQIRKAQKLLQDPALNAAERERRQKQQQKMINEARETAQALQQYNRATQTELQKEQADTIKKLMDEVREVVGTIAKSKGYSLVIDSSAKTGPGLVLVFADGKDDLTTAAQSQLETTNPERTSVNPKPPKKKD
ncbi:MAG: OmpH family outer membrane protein [Verrucomicrobiota bacterium]|jgi:Skp family chaperone for outer membrane proteins|nr:OmpH family outer membrane protein [Verrucomicrobiota bacterium]